jgi:hypothetical protein
MHAILFNGNTHQLCYAQMQLQVTLHMVLKRYVNVILGNTQIKYHFVKSRYKA